LTNTAAALKYRDPRAWQGPFPEFIRQVGPETLAKELGVQLSTIYHWINGSWCPTRDKAKRIARIAIEAGVVLSTDDVLDHQEKVRARLAPTRVAI
jgi:hypothetical protein